ncbi:MAG: MBL fold metallo-hydrolase [Prevotellaceae bacterium]|jgi:glyoxylase-like metal-dependent hydrolase (beta-lactamase superfamily II)|nr:MBL fold metallo-hydrolase [Prevotellaceae bacterium]
MKKTLSTLLLAAAPLAAGAQEAAAPALFSYKVGAYEVMLLPETQGRGNASILIGATPGMMAETMPEGTYPNAVNAFAVKTPGSGILLFDTGFGRHLFEHLSQVGIAPEAIDTLVITHLHGDHIGGMLVGGKRAFPRARLLLSEVEKNYWVDRQQQAAATKAVEAYAANTTLLMPQSLEELAALLETAGDVRMKDGLYWVAAPGHTPGHTVCLLQSEGSRLLIWGDLAHAMAVQMPYPEVSVRYDTDPAMAAATRKHILHLAAKHQIPVAGMHIAYPGIGTIEENGAGGYRFLPVPHP